MKRNQDTVKGIVLGSVLTFGLTASMGNLSAAGIYKKLEAAFNDIKVNVQGKAVELTDAKGKKVEPFIVDGTTYLPVRAMAEVLGQPVEWDSHNNTVYIAKPQAQNEGVQVVTAQEIKMEEGRIHANIQVPAIVNLKDEVFQSTLNQRFLKDAEKSFQNFKEEIIDKNGAPLAIDGGYKVVTDTEQLLSIQRYTVKTAASGVETIQYDTIDKKSNEWITLRSLFKDDQFLSVISEDIKQQMRAQMKEDEGKVYWVRGSSLPDENVVDPFETITGDQPFYINNDGNLVISFNEYEVAPGYMGIVEFVIPTEAIEDLLVSHQYIK
ncbi:DUF3298 domain-containing protein [Ammoniphilus resinae]|uniref:DUF3298 domain-containing protein n=1 Tax=Ammoniphilus resinae TaxID=861532 RepID=A0ABS4GIS3_9BACL|nr:DUF3298 domain-containing protein [Ammoniphilus resinae]MBP1930057.1 hypothetical protein [Ammoniphilus resinae]